MRRTVVGAAVAASLGPAGVGSAEVPAVAGGQSESAQVRGEGASARVARVPISFRVRNVNRSAVACAADGKTYTVRGHLVGPADEVRARRIDAATVYLHGLSFGDFFWNFRPGTGDDYATGQARRGQVSVTVDRLGYGRSDKLPGDDVCVGSRADMTHQMIMKLRSGHYRLGSSGAAPRVSKVVLAGHSYGGQIAQVEAYSFGDIDGVVVIGYADRVQSALLGKNAAYAARVCATGGLRVDGSGPAGYAPFGPPAGAAKALFYSSPRRVKAAALKKLTIDPCGDTASFAKAVKVDLAKVRSIRVPVLVVGGGRDRLFPPPAAANQARLFTGSTSVAHTQLADTAHAFTLERTRLRFATVIRQGLHRHAFGS